MIVSLFVLFRDESSYIFKYFVLSPLVFRLIL